MTSYANKHAGHAELHRDGALAELGARQAGRVSVGQLRAIGLGRGAIAHRVRAGSLIRVEHGVFAVGHRVWSRKGDLWTAILAAGDDTVLSYRTGAEVWSIKVRRGRKIEVTTPRQLRSRPRVTRHFTCLRPDEMTVCDGLPVTTMQRTVFDLASVMERDELQPVLEQAEHRLMDFKPVLEMMARHPTRKGVRLLKELAPRIRPVDPKSWLESDLAPFLLSLGAPDPLRNWFLETAKGLEEVDFFYPPRLIIEGDGYAFHGGASNLTRDHQKDRRLRKAGYRVERVTYDELHYDTAALAAFLTPLFASHSQR